ncbi:MAG: adenylate/guanylate cyclase domain-containing protein, partial [candidate division Zixibacteria bacterium]|nr:adenylate/guanylate cyclase domain-containing protein [candidate division Zixibacteria bacterium]
EGQKKFIQALDECGRVINAVALYPEDKDHFRYAMKENPFVANIPPSENMESLDFTCFDRIEGPPKALADASAKLGFVNFFPDPDGVTRRTPLALKFSDDMTFPLSLTSLNVVFDNGSNPITYEDGYLYPAMGYSVPVDEDGDFMINFVGPPRSFRYISYYDVREKRLPPDYFNGKFVFVGTSAVGLSDLKIVPMANDFPGVEIHATVMYNILTNEFLKPFPKAIILPVLIIITLLLGILFYRSGPFIGFILFFILVLIYFIFVVFMFVKNSTVIELVQPVFTFSLTYMFVIVHRYFGEEQEKKKYRGILQHYVAPTVVKEIVDNIDGMKLGGESRELTMFFSDIEGFTDISERLTPQQLVTFLNSYTSKQTEAVFEYFGTLDKYIGDALVVIFGAPEVRKEINYAECACRAAIKVSENDKFISKRFRNFNLGNVRTRIGINTGEVVVGNMGSNVRFTYTVLGDHVNLASRLEGLNKKYLTSIIISEMTRNKTSKDFITRELDMVRVKGRSMPVRIYELIKYGKPDDKIKKLLESFSAALDLYRKKDFKSAKESFLKILEFNPDDGPSKIFAKRCSTLVSSPPPEDWEGIWVM